jgi:GSH-dependent disulfide-bond oxidoreductase
LAHAERDEAFDNARGGGGPLLSPPRKPRFVGETVRLLNVLERRLGEAAYLAEEYSIADVAAFTWVNFAMPTIRSNVGNALGGTPAVDRWLSEINSRPAVQRGLRAPKIVIGRAKPIT